MSRPIVYAGLFLAWIAMHGRVWAQQPARLRVDANRLAKARTMERQAVATGDTAGLIEAFYQYGRTYVFAGDYRTSQEYFLRSLRLLEPRGNSPELARIYVRLCENENRLNRQADALRFARQALAIARQIQHPHALPLAYGAVARVYEAIWEQHLPGFSVRYDSVETYYRRKMPFFRASNDTLGMAETWLELGTLRTKVRDHRAVPNLLEALRLTRLLHRDALVPNVLLHLSTAYLTFGQAEKAHRTLQEANARYLANRFDNYDAMLGLEHQFVRYYRTTGQWQRAYAHLEKLRQLEQNEWLSDRETAIARLNVQYETQKTAARLKAQQSELVLQRENAQTQRQLTRMTTGLLGLALVMSGLFFWLFRKYQRASRRNEQLVKEQNHRVKNSMQVAASLLNLHANRLSDGAAKQAVEASRLRIQAMAILHQRLYDGDQLAQVDLNEFIHQLAKGILSAYNFRDVETSIDVDSITLPAEKAMPLGLIINEVLTNACKHAFPLTDQPRLQLDCRRSATHLHLRIQDNGPGLDGPGLDNERDWTDEPVISATDGVSVLAQHSFGMQLIQSLTTQLHGTYQFQAGQGCAFTLEFKI